MKETRRSKMDAQLICTTHDVLGVLEVWRTLYGNLRALYSKAFYGRPGPVKDRAAEQCFSF
jgi:hypothetical protein